MKNTTTTANAMIDVKGNVGLNISTYTTQKGVKGVRFSLAVHKGEETAWITCFCTAENTVKAIEQGVQTGDFIKVKAFDNGDHLNVRCFQPLYRKGAAKKSHTKTAAAAPRKSVFDGLFSK